MFEITCLHCNKQILRANISEKFVIVCDCGFKLIEDWKPTNNAKIIQKAMYGQNSSSTNREAFRQRTIEKYGKQSDN